MEKSDFTTVYDKRLDISALRFGNFENAERKNTSNAPVNKTFKILKLAEVLAVRAVNPAAKVK